MKLRGVTLTMAILKVAEGTLTDGEISAQLRVPIEKLQAAKLKPFFVARVAEERETLKLEKTIRKA